MKRKIRKKLTLSMLIATSIVYSIAFAYIFNVMIKEEKDSAIEITKQIGERYKLLVKSEIEKSFLIAHSFASALKKYPDLEQKERDNIYIPMIKETVLNDRRYMSVWYSWELSAINQKYHKPYGRVRHAFFQQQEISQLNIDTLNLEGDDPNSLYYNLKISNRPLMMPLYIGNYTGNRADSIKMTTAIVPLQKHGKFLGVVGLDINLDFLHQLTEKIKPSPESKTFIISPEGNFATFSGAELPKISYLKYFSSENQNIQNTAQIFKEPKSFYETKNGIEYYVLVLPITIINAEKPWAIGIMQPISEIYKKVKETIYVFLIVSLIGLLFVIYVISIFSARIINPLKKITQAINSIVEGNIDLQTKPNIKTGDEIEEMSQSLGTLIENLNSTANFAIEIGKGNLDYKFKSASENDILSNSLLKMRDDLKKNRDELEFRKIEDKKINWLNAGTVKFADITRKYNKDIDKLAYEIIRNLVKYLEANQGGLFLVKSRTQNQEEKLNLTGQDSQKYLDLIVSYAFDRRKYIQKQVDINVGLLGRVVKEAETIYMTDLPQNYIHITSGLGEANPSSLLLVPMMYNNQVFGVIELASFRKFEDYKIKFIETISESIATAIRQIQTTVDARKLLKESQAKSQAIAEQEEKTRRDIEIIRSEISEISNKKDDFEQSLKAIKKAALYIEYDINGKIIDVNDSFINLLKINKENLIGRYQGSFNNKQTNIKEFNKVWRSLRKGEIKHINQFIDTVNGVILLKMVYVPVFNQKGKVYKVISISTTD